MKDKEKQKERGKIATELIVAIGEMENCRKELRQLTKKVEQKTREVREIIKRAEELKGK